DPGLPARIASTCRLSTNSVHKPAYKSPRCHPIAANTCFQVPWIIRIHFVNTLYATGRLLHATRPRRNTLDPHRGAVQGQPAMGLSAGFGPGNGSDAHQLSAAVDLVRRTA